MTDVDPTPVTPARVFEVQSQYGKVEFVLDNPHAKRLTFFLLGDRKKGFIPPPKMFQDFREKLEAALREPGDRVVLTHPFLSVLQVDLPEGPVVVTSPEPKLGPEEPGLDVFREWAQSWARSWGAKGWTSANTDKLETEYGAAYRRGVQDERKRRVSQGTAYWYLIEGKRVPVPAEALSVVEAYDTPVQVFQVRPRRVPVDSPFDRGMRGEPGYEEARLKDLNYVLDVHRLYLHGA